MDPSPSESFNCGLAGACQATEASCCKKGKIFLPPSEYQAILDWLQTHSPAEIDSFKARCAHHDDAFILYDQEQRCQFLDDANLCRLHRDKVKPSECFWWPLHVYTPVEGEGLEIRVATCCEGYRCKGDLEGYLEEIEARAKVIGYDRIRAFRKVYEGNSDKKIAVKRI